MSDIKNYLIAIRNILIWAVDGGNLFRLELVLKMVEGWVNELEQEEKKGAKRKCQKS